MATGFCGVAGLQRVWEVLFAQGRKQEWSVVKCVTTWPRRK